MTTSPSPLPTEPKNLQDGEEISARAGLNGTHKLAVVLIGSYALVLIMVVISIWALLSHDRQRELDRQQTELVSLARALEEHVSRTVGHVDSGLQFLSRMLEHEPRISAESVDALSLYARQWLKSAPHAAALSIVDNRGQPLLLVQQAWLRDAANEGATHPITTIDSPPAHSSSSLTMGAPVKLRVASQGAATDNEAWFIPVMRPITGTGGKRIGVASGLISTRYFDEFYRDMQFAPRDTITLVSPDDKVLLRYPMNDADMGAKLAVDGAPHINASRRIKAYGLVINIARPQEVALNNYFEIRNRVIIGGGLLIGLLALTTWIVYRDTRQREIDRAQLREINASLEARVSRRTAELEQSNRDLVGFSYSISHDLRTPLRAINGFAHALMEDGVERLDALGQDHLARICRASVRMGELIDELLNLANVARRPLNVQPVQLSALLSDLFEELRIAEPERIVNFSLQPDMHAEGDEALLRNALSNLLHNAWKFTRGQAVAEISITAHATADYMNYSVSDNGMGFNMAHAKRLFQPFQQLHGDHSFGGTGIGLASVRRIIERHGGHIWAESSLGQGARFIFTLPHRVAVVRRRRRQSTPASINQSPT